MESPDTPGRFSGTDTVDTYAYATGTNPAQPHDLQSVIHKIGGTKTGTDTYGYDASGDTTSAPGHTYGYDQESRLATDTTSAGTETRVYNTDGTLLLQSGPAGIKLWLGDTEVISTSAGISAVRTYDALGKQIAERTTPPGGSTSTVYDVETDPDGTITQTIATTAAMTVTNRYSDPFGNPRAATTGRPDDKSFLGDPTDPANDLVAVGQRTYSPTLGRFLTVDPEMEADSPQQLNGYGYAADDPISHPDPTGLAVGGLNGNQRSQLEKFNQDNDVDNEYLTTGQSLSPSINSVADYSHGTPHGSGAYIWEGPASPPSVRRHHGFGFHSIINGVARVEITSTDAVASVGAGVLNSGVSMVTGGAVNLNLQPCLSSADASVCRFGRDVGNSAAFVAVQFVPGADEVADGELAAEGAEGLEAGGEAIDEGVSDGEASEEADSDGSSCNANSFSPSTGVLLATGRLVPISRVKVGDLVKATNPKTGRSTTRAVSKLWINDDTDLMDLTVRTPSGITSVIDTTARHPFWDTTTGRWTAVELLAVGDGLRTATGGTLTVVATKVVPGSGYMWDLTVNVDHDFYVAAGSSTVLVHNCSVPDQIANGHAWAKHAVEFPEFSTPDELSAHITDVMQDGASRDLLRGRAAFYDEETNTVVIRNPADPDMGTVFRAMRFAATYEDLQ